MKSVSLVGCEDYNYSRVKECILKSFENIGGIEPYISKGEKVLLKVNLLMKKTPDKAVTTNPVFVRCLAEVLVEYGAEVIIGDSPGGPFNEMILKSIYNASGMTEAAEKSGASLNFDTSAVQVQNSKGLILKKLTVTNMAKNVDKIISVSKLKTHCMARMTGAVKNMFGIIPGALKAEYHLNMPTVDNFANALIDICLWSNTVLSFMDGIVGMEGDGPSSGTPRHVGVILASESPFVLDMAAAKIINVSNESIPTIKNSIKRGICPDSLTEDFIIGESIDKFIVNDFKAPRVVNINPYRGKIPKFAESFMNSYLQPRPIFNHDKCISCENCFKNCPPKTIKMIDNKPVVNIENCIRCFCCQELCPCAAVSVHRPILFNILSKI